MTTNPTRDPLDSADGSDASDDQIVLAELVMPTVAKPSAWTASIVGILAMILATVVGGVVLGGLLLVSDGHSVREENPDIEAWLEHFVQTPLGLLAIVIPGQLVFLGVAVGAASLSPLPGTTRLGLGRGKLPGSSWFVFMLGTPIIGLLGSYLVSSLAGETSEQLELVETMLRAHSQRFLPGLIVIVAIVPGFVEELLFRGYLQRRLLGRWPPAMAIGVSALMFSAAHMDPMHAFGVLPLGIWLGVIAWRAESIWPAILCHVVNNVVAIGSATLQDAGHLEMAADPFSVALLAAGGPAFLIACAVLARSGKYATGRAGGA